MSTNISEKMRNACGIEFITETGYQLSGLVIDAVPQRMAV